MSALAARRAAAAAAQASSPVQAVAPAPLAEAGPSSTKRRRPNPPRPRSPSLERTPSLDGLDDANEPTGSEREGRQPVQVKPRQHKTPKSEKKTVRYFAETPEQPKSVPGPASLPTSSISGSGAKRKRGKRGFSPSAPVVLDGSSDAESGADASSDEDSASVDGAGWTAATGNAVAGPSRLGYQQSVRHKHYLCI